MFLDKTTDDEFFASLQKGLEKAHAFEDDLQGDQIKEALHCLAVAAQSLNNVGLVKEAKMVETLKLVCEDPPTKNLTSAKMLKNLEEKGWVFNAKDRDFEDESDAEDEEIEVESSPE